VQSFPNSVNEAYLRLVSDQARNWQNRAHVIVLRGIRADGFEPENLNEPGAKFSISPPSAKSIKCRSHSTLSIGIVAVVQLGFTRQRFRILATGSAERVTI
jgi:hypothetical protein